MHDVTALSTSGVFAGIVLQSPEAIVFADCAGVIGVWSPGAEALFGFSAAQAVGQSLDLIIPERFRAAHWAGFDRAVANRRTQHGGQIRTTRALHADGRKLYVEMSFSIVIGSDGAVLGSVAIARDATERHARERAAAARPPVAAG